MRSSARSFERFVDAHAAELLRTACLITWDEAEAEDLVQECLVRVAARWPRVRTMASPFAYARKVLINQALDGRTRRRRRQEELRDSAAPEILDERGAAAIELVGTRAELIAALSCLSRQQRTVLGLRFVEDLSEAQVAELLGCSVGTVKSSASRGLGRLRELLSDQGTEVCER